VAQNVAFIPTMSADSNTLNGAHYPSNMMDANVTIAVISASSVLLGGFSTALIQHLLTKATASREEKRQRQIEFKKHLEECLVNLLEESDPDIYPVPSIPTITRNIITLQLYLDLKDKDHRELNGCLNRLGRNLLSAPHETSLILRSHSDLLDAGNKVIKKYNLPATH